MYRAKPLSEKIAAFSIPEPNTGCWLWIGNLHGCGYGLVKTPGNKRALAHRVSYEVAFGPIPDGLQIDHRCRVRCCVNPAHLDAVTSAENMRRAGPYRRKRNCASGHPMAEAYVRANGSRSCRACALERSKKANASRPNKSGRRVVLTPALAADVRRRVALGERQVDVARSLGLTKMAINHVVRGRNWLSSDALIEQAGEVSRG